MPKLRRRTSPVGIILLAAFALGYGFALWKKPLLVGALTLAAVAFTFVHRDRTRRHLNRLAQERGEESICSFSREFDTRGVDTWVIRAVYEQLQEYLSGDHPAFPLRPSDRLLEDLKLDSDDLELDLASEISERTGRSLDNAKANPHYAKVQTVADLVFFFCAQPKRAT